MRIPIAREGYPFIGAAAVPALALWAAFAVAPTAGFSVAASALSALALAFAAFFRDPERRGAAGEGAVVAPADGRIIEIADDDADYLEGPAKRISIFLSLFDVHVNRYPISGSIEHRDYQAGRFEPAWRRSASRSNERASTGIKGDRHPVLVRQIAGLAAKRIVTYARLGDQVRRGERMGLIRFGSRVDLFVPTETQISVVVGQRTVGGVTALGRLPIGEGADDS